jgi:hypothetical protein
MRFARETITALEITRLWCVLSQRWKKMIVSIDENFATYRGEERADGVKLARGTATIPMYSRLHVMKNN